jgi:hypothetical protein
MRAMSPSRNLVFAVLAAGFVSLFTSCNDGAKTTGDISKNRAASLPVRKLASDNPPTGYENYPGDALDTRGTLSAIANSRAETAGPATRRTGTGTAFQPSAASSTTATWSLVLGTFTDEGHAAAAEQMIIGLRTVAPQVTGARVHSTSKGSMVVVGNFNGRDDPAAKEEIARLKAIKYQGRQVFDRVILTKLDLRLSRGELHPYDLLSARKAHPKVDPLYTLEIAIWIANDDPKAGDRITFDEVKRRAEAQVTQLRLEGYEAYFYHDEDTQRSEVTVGLFDRTAIHPVSGLYSDEVRQLYKRFPERKANGEIIYEPVAVREPNERQADIWRRPQTPVLVLVPTM